MKTTSNKLSIKKETVNSFANLTEKEMQEVHGGVGANKSYPMICYTTAPWECPF